MNLFTQIRPLRKWPWQRVLTLGLSLRARIVLGALIPVAAICLYFLHALNMEKQLDKTTHEILDHRMVMMHAAEGIKQSLVAYDDALFRYLALQDASQLTEGKHWKNEVEINLKRLNDLSVSPILRARLDVLHKESDQYFLDAERLLEYFKKNNTPTSLIQQRSTTWNRETGQEHLELAFLSAEGKARLVRVFSLCEEILTVNRLELERAQLEMNQALNAAHRAGAILSVLVIAGLALLSVGFILSLLSPLRNLLQGIHQIQEGDLNVEIPVTTQDEVGALTVAFNRATRIIREQRDQLLKETITDGLTGTYNQRHFHQLLRREVERSHRSGEPVSLLMIDLDHFKEINDTYGHQFGNNILKNVCDIIRETMREIDLLARYGGDEFALILPRAGFQEAKTVAQRILDRIGGHQIPAIRVGKPEITPGISMGGATYPVHAISAEDLIHRADQALYNAKSAGRGRWQWAASPMESSGSLEVAGQ